MISIRRVVQRWLVTQRPHPGIVSNEQTNVRDFDTLFLLHDDDMAMAPLRTFRQSTLVVNLTDWRVGFILGERIAPASCGFKNF